MMSRGLGMISLSRGRESEQERECVWVRLRRDEPVS